MNSTDPLDDLKTLFHSIIGDSVQWAVLLGLLALLLIVICAGFAFLISAMENNTETPRPRR